MKNNYLYRMGAAVLGIYGNSKEDAIYPIYSVDEANEKLSGANKYTLRFPPGQLPPVNAFWSLTMYKMPESLLVANPINRYLLNSPMMPQFKRDADGGLTLAHSEQIPGEGQGGQLATCAGRAIPNVFAPLLAEGRSAGWRVDQAAVATGRVNASHRRFQTGCAHSSSFY